jgi:O-antigen/teichoic acid export membrane protein
MNSNRTVRRLLWNSATSYINLTISFASSFILVPITLHYLGKEQYGLLQLVGSLAGYISLASLGTGAALMRTVAQARDADPPVDLSPTLSTAFFFYLSLGAIGFIVGLSALPVLPSIFHIPQDQRWISQLLVIISFVGALITFPLSVFMGVLIGRERFDLSNLVRGVQSLSLFGATVLAFWSGGRLVTLIVVQTLLSIGSSVVLVWFAYREIPNIRISPKLVRLSELRQILSFGVFAFCVQIAVQISYRTDTVVIGIFLPLGAIAIYNIGLRLSEIARDIPSQISGLLPPVIARMDQQKQPEDLERIFLASTKWILLIALAVAIPLLLFVSPFIRIWLGSDFGETGLITRVLCISGIFAIAQGPAATLLMYKGKHKFMAASSLTASAANLVLSIILVRHWGILGVALGTAIPVLLADGFIVFPLACRLIRMPLRRLFIRALLPPLAPAVLTIVIMSVACSKWNPTSLLEVVLAMAGASCVYLLIFSLCSLSVEDRKSLLFHAKNFIVQNSILRQHAAKREPATSGPGV